LRNEKSVTIRDVAEAANVSRSLVSFVLNGRADVADQTRARVLQEIERLGYRPNRIARNLAHKSTGAVGFVLPSTHPDALTMQFLTALLDALAGTPFRLMALREDYADLLDALDEKTVDGLFFMDINAHHPDYIRIQNHSVPVSSVWHHLPESTLSDGFLQLGQHLSIRGHNEVIVMAGSAHMTGQLKSSLLSAFSLTGIGIQAWVDGVETDEQAVRMSAEIQETQRPTAIVTLSDVIALGVLQGVRQKRARIPEDVAVTGFGDIPMAGTSNPSLTTIRVPFKDIAKRAIDTLANAELLPVQPCQLIIRRSC